MGNINLFCGRFLVVFKFSRRSWKLALAKNCLHLFSLRHFINTPRKSVLIPDPEPTEHSNCSVYGFRTVVRPLFSLRHISVWYIAATVASRQLMTSVECYHPNPCYEALRFNLGKEEAEAWWHCLLAKNLCYWKSVGCRRWSHNL